MPNTPFGSLQGKPSFDELVDYVVRLERKLNYVINGALDSDNIFEAGGWRITPDQLASKDQDVGMSTTDTGGDDVRFWAGGTDKDTAPWRVYKSGKGVATGWTVQSTSGSYPKIVLDPDGNLFGAYRAADNYIEMNPNVTAVELDFVNGSTTGFIQAFNVLDNCLLIGSNFDIRLAPSGGHSVRVPTWARLLNEGTSQNLQSALNAKQDTFSGYSGSVSVVTGVDFTGETTSTSSLNFSNGILTSVT